MPIETVDVLVQDDEVTPNPVDGVNVLVYDATGTTLQTSGITGTPTAGHVEFSLNGEAAPNPVVYQLRFAINGGTIVSPQQIEVYSPASGSPTGTNNFEITASLFTLPVATDPRLCRCSGYVRGPDGRPRPGVNIQFIPCFNPLVVDGIGVYSERVETRTDEAGYVVVDLYRDGYYMATVESHENIQRQVLVPDRSSVNINNLLFPVVSAVTFSPVGPWNLTVGGELEITPTVTASDFRTLEGSGAEDVLYAVDDSSIATVDVASDKIVVRGVAAGSTTLTVTRSDTSIVYIPDPGVSGGSVTINVT